MRILVTGSRTWDDEATIEKAIADAISWGAANWLITTNDEVTVVHGAARNGADDIAESLCVMGDIRTEKHPADWSRFGKSAGFKRNAEMVSLGADICLAFIKDGSPGATHAAALAEQAGIPTRRYTA